MKICIDIGHPAHIHYFRNFMRLMSEKGHEFFVSARDKEMSHILLDKYNISYFNRGRGSDNLVGKFFYLIKTVVILLFKCRAYKPDIFISFASPYVTRIKVIRGKSYCSYRHR